MNRAGLVSLTSCLPFEANLKPFKKAIANGNHKSVEKTGLNRLLRIKSLAFIAERDNICSETALPKKFKRNLSEWTSEISEIASVLQIEAYSIKLRSQPSVQCPSGIVIYKNDFVVYKNCVYRCLDVFQLFVDEQEFLNPADQRYWLKLNACQQIAGDNHPDLTGVSFHRRLFIESENPSKIQIVSMQKNPSDLYDVLAIPVDSALKVFHLPFLVA